MLSQLAVYYTVSEIRKRNTSHSSRHCMLHTAIRTMHALALITASNCY
jgi:hypothetical protein